MFELINDLSESKSFRNKDALGKLDDQKAKDLLFIHVAILLSLVQDEEYGKEAKAYFSKAIAFGNFDYFRTSGNDLYMLAFDQKDDKYFDEKHLIRFIQSVIMGNYGMVYSYLNKLHTSLKVKNGNFSRFKRYAAYWSRVSDSEKKRALEMALVEIRRDMPNSELLQMLRGR